MLLRCLFVSQVEEEYAGQGADQEDDVEPAVVEVELQLSEDLRDDGAVLQWHAHSDQQHGRDEVHAHYLCQQQDNDIGRLTARDGVEELGKSDQQSSDRCDNDYSNQDEGNMLGPELHVKLDPQIVHGDLNASGDRVGFPNSVKNDVNGGHENFPNAVNREKVTQKIKIFSLESFGIFYSLLRKNKHETWSVSATHKFI